MLRHSGICWYISRKYPAYKDEEKGWKDKIKENLNHKEVFERVQSSDGLKCFWRIREGHEESIPEVHSCPTCGERFGKEIYLKAHLVKENHGHQQANIEKQFIEDQLPANDMRNR